MAGLQSAIWLLVLPRPMTVIAGAGYIRIVGDSWPGGVYLYKYKYIQYPDPGCITYVGGLSVFR